jgi:hypothetical protein
MRPLKRVLIFVHRWLGVALSVLFLLWFPSGIVMMYWGFPDVAPADRLARSAPLDASAIRVTPAAAVARLGLDQPPDDVRLNTFDGRPAYRIGSAGPERLVFADTGETDPPITPELMARAAARWSGQPVAAATVTELTAPDQWTVQRFRSVTPVWKYVWPDGQQVYVTQITGEVVQATTTESRVWAYLGAIPHWFYFTALRQHGPEWSRVVIWTSGIGTLAAILGLVVGVWMFSPRKGYRHAGAATAIPYRGQKRLHTIFGLIFGLGTVTWAFSGMLSMEPFPLSRGGDADEPSEPTLREGIRLQDFAASDLRMVIAQFPAGSVKELDFTSFADRPMYLATLGGGETRVVPLDGPPQSEFDRAHIIALVRRAAGDAGIADVQVIDEYDRYYLDRNGEAPLPVIRARYTDTQRTRMYIDPATARIVSEYRDGDWMRRWLYHGLHSLDFPWLYQYRPLWDIVVLTFMVGGTALCVTSLILAWRLLGRKLRALLPAGSAAPTFSEDLVP